MRSGLRSIPSPSLLRRWFLRCPDSVWAPRFWQPLFPSRRLKSTGVRSFLGDPFRKRSRILRYLVQQWMHVASVHGLCLATETGTHSANCDRFWSLCPFTPAFAVEEVATLVIQRWYGWFCRLRCNSRCVGISRCFLLVCRQAQDFRHHGRYGQEALHQPVEIHRCSSWYVDDMPVVVQRHRVHRQSVDNPVYAETGTFSAKLCILDWLLTCPLFCMSRSLTSLSWRRGRVRRPRRAGPANSSGAGGEETVKIPQLQLVEAWTLLLTCPLVFNNRCWVVQNAENCGGPQLQVWNMVDMPVVLRQVPQVQFLPGGGRRCAHAAMRSSCRS